MYGGTVVVLDDMDGRTTPCGMMNEPVARPFEIGFSDAWKSIYQATDEILLPSECKNCKKRFACMMCGALTIAEGGGCSYKKPEVFVPADRGVPRRDGERIPETGKRGTMTNTQKELLQALRCFMQGG